MNSTISSSTPRVAPRVAPAAVTSAVETPDSKSIVNTIIDKTYLGANYTASALSGGIAGLGAYVTHAGGSMAKSFANVYPNLHKAEIIGPNITGIGYLVAAPTIVAATLLGLPASLFSGLVEGVKVVDSSHPREFTIGEASKAGYQDTSKDWNSYDNSVKEAFESMGNQKLAPGEKPFDIPLTKVGKSVAVGAAAAAIGGVAGVAGAAAMFGRESATGIASAFTHEDMSFGARLTVPVGAVLGAAGTSAVYGVSTAVYTVANGIHETWSNDSLVAGAKEVINDGARTIAVAIAPETALLHEVPTSKN